MENRLSGGMCRKNAESLLNMTRGALVQLDDLSIEANKLSGCVPDAVGGMAQMTSLHVGWNRLRGLHGKGTIIQQCQKRPVESQWPHIALYCDAIAAIIKGH